MADEKNVRIYCNHCKTHTRHEFIDLHEYHFSGEDGAPDEWGQYRFWACAGCDTCTMENHYTADYMMNEEGENLFASSYFPERAHSVRPSKYFITLPPKLTGLYSEIISSY